MHDPKLEIRRIDRFLECKCQVENPTCLYVVIREVSV